MARRSEGQYKLYLVPSTDPDYKMVEEKMQSTIVKHQSETGGVFGRYKIVQISKIENSFLRPRYEKKKTEIARANGGRANERLFFHGTKDTMFIDDGFSVKLANPKGMFGAGLYFAEHSSKSNQYVLPAEGCSLHKSRSCYFCFRVMLLCKVTMGKMFETKKVMKVNKAPSGYHSVHAPAALGFLKYPEFIVYDDDQAYPQYCVLYRIAP
jgi:tankyrase